MNRKERLHAILNSQELPTLPSVAVKLITLTSKKDATLADISELISQDISLSSKILKVANSSLYGLSHQVGSIKQAVSILGINAVRSLILSFSFLNMNDGKTSGSFDFEKFWEKSLAAGVGIKMILDKIPESNSEDAFLSGLLQNLGELILIKTFPDEYEKLLQEAGEDTDKQIQLEEKVFSANHAFIGFEVAHHWGFPDELLLQILYHHEPDQCPADDKNVLLITRATYLSNLLAGILYSSDPEKFHAFFREEARRLLGFVNKDIEDILSNINEQVEDAGKSFGLEIQNTKSIKDILQEANIRLSLMNLDYEQMNKELIKAKMELEKLTQELQEKNKALDNLVNVDGLTGVFNHRYFQNHLSGEINKAQRKSRSLALIMLDIDDFKKFNDTYGHQVGDMILIKFCEIITSCLREYDVLARYGGEEFIVILSETALEQACKVAEKVRKTIESAKIKDRGFIYHLRASLGVTAALLEPDESFSQQDFISEADQALYKAKHLGKNRVEAYAQKPKKNALKKALSAMRHSN